MKFLPTEPKTWDCVQTPTMINKLQNNFLLIFSEPNSKSANGHDVADLCKDIM